MASRVVRVIPEAAMQTPCLLRCQARTSGALPDLRLSKDRFIQC
jgi:hypothetical protein